MQTNSLNPKLTAAVTEPSLNTELGCIKVVDTFRPVLSFTANKHRENGYDGLRLIAATLVIIGHSYPLTGRVAPALLANGIQTIAVKAFFVISGYLIARSWIGDPDIRRYAAKRFLRIFPGLTLVCLLTVLLVGPIFTEFGNKAYFASPWTWFYVWNLALYPIYGLPGVFTHNIYGPAVNGSLWSLPVEVAMYLLIVVVTTSSRIGRQISVTLTAVMLLACSVFWVRIHPPASPVVIWGTSTVSFLDAAYYFFAGAAIITLGLQRFASWSLGIVSFTVASVFVKGPVAGEIALAFVLPYAVMSIGITHTALLDRLNGCDYSYGLYLYGFPIQQALIDIVGPQTPGFNAAATLPLALMMAALSWHIVEERALRLKPRPVAASVPGHTGRPRTLGDLVLRPRWSPKTRPLKRQDDRVPDDS